VFAKDLRDPSSKNLWVGPVTVSFSPVRPCRFGGRRKMSEVVKRGYLSVRRRNLLASSSYKQRFVVLKMGGEGRGKLVEVWDSQSSEKDPYRLVLGNSWTVQTKPSNSGKRYAFQVNVTALHDHDLIV
jgi:hypothetical protein